MVFSVALTAAFGFLNAVRTTLIAFDKLPPKTDRADDVELKDIFTSADRATLKDAVMKLKIRKRKNAKIIDWLPRENTNDKQH